MTHANEEKIYKDIKLAIIQQKLRPNMKLVEDEIAESFGVSRTPVRNVLRRLAYEKLLTIIPRKGTFVSCPTVEEAKEVFELRRALESVAVESACSNMTKDDYVKLKEMIDEEHNAHLHGDFYTTLYISGDFHLKIAEIAGNSYNYRYLEELTSLTYVIIALYGYRHLKLCGDDEHTLILEAIKKKDSSLAKKLIMEHLTQIEMHLDFADISSAPMSFSEIFNKQGI